MTEETFCRIEENFKLSKVTISSLFNSSGVCSRFTEYDEKTRKPKYLRVVIKSKQKVNAFKSSTSRQLYGRGTTEQVDRC